MYLKGEAACRVEDHFYFWFVLVIDYMKKLVHDVLKKNMTEDYIYSASGDPIQRSRSTAFGYMMAILESGRSLTAA